MANQERVNAYRSKVADELRFIEERDGVLRPEAVVEYAKNKKTELHKEFNWDDTTAAHQWRLQQARQVIRAIVTIIPNNDEEVITNAYVHFDDPNNGYISIVKVLSDDDLKSQMLRTAKKELETFRKKYAELRELSDVFVVIDTILNPKPKK